MSNKPEKFEPVIKPGVPGLNRVKSYADYVAEAESVLPQPKANLPESAKTNASDFLKKGNR